ncbi:MAG: hypothetical protein KA120_04315 [Candidatus Goldbacteria bacterium]|nr:hypothetical protein [Candidatus Goldiibacteriota bacterium]HPD18679.1 hypothetical protein [Candidatus Goldiibacteriota bacterium]
MKKYLNLIIVIVFISNTIFASDAVYNGIPGAFADIGLSRPSALAGAYVAVCDDASGIFYNPAGLATSEYKDITFMYAKQKFLVPYNYGAFIWPFNKQRGVGFGMIVSGDQVLLEQTYMLSYSENLNWLLGRIISGIYVGTNLKFHFANFGYNESDDPDKVGGSAWGIGMDYGLLWELPMNVKFGVMIKDGFSYLKWDTIHNPESVTEGVPLTSSFGFSYKVKNALVSIALSDLDTLRLGGELTLFDYIDLRAGILQELTVESYREYSVGLGIGRFEFGAKKEYSMNLDAAFAFERLTNTLKIQTSFKFK